MSGNHYIQLGRFGLAINIVALVWMAYEFIWLMFPLYLPVDASIMNYSSAVFAGVMLVSAINWFCYSNKAYSVPLPMHVGSSPASTLLVSSYI